MRKLRYLAVFLFLLVGLVALAQTSNIRTQHKVAKGETIFGIAKSYEVTMDALIEVNPSMKEVGYELKKGDIINIPYSKKTQPQAAPKTNASTQTTTPTTTTLANEKTVKVGVMLPLHDKNGDGLRMVEYYRGLLLACDRVKKDGITVDMHAWNVPLEADINETLKEKEAEQCNIIIGPLYTKMVKPLAEFCKKHNILLVIPFSISGNDVENYSNIFQVYQSDQDFDRATIRNFIQQFNGYHPVIIDCGDLNSTKGAFTKALRQELDSKGIAYSLTSLNSNEKDFVRAFSLSQRNVVILNTERSPSVNETLVKLNALTAKNTDLQVSLFGYKEWLMYVNVYKDYYFKYDTYIPTYFFYNGQSADTKWVEANYRKWFERDMDSEWLPRFALTGFDHGCFFIGGLSQFGNAFNGGKGQMTYKAVQSPLRFKKIGQGQRNVNFMFVHYNPNRSIESINY